MRDFEYEAPESIAAAVELLQRHAGTARPLAGGTDLIDHIRTGRLAPDVVIDIKRIPDLNRLELEPTGLRLGAAVPCRKIIAHPGIRRHFSALADACSIIGGTQIQTRASVGGNLCTSGAAADSTPALIALNATCRIAGPDGERRIPVDEFCTGPAENVLGPGELLVDFEIPSLVSDQTTLAGSHYRRFIPRNEMDIAVVGVGASVVLNHSASQIVSARVALGAVSSKPFLANEVNIFLQGQSADESVLIEAGNIARSLISPIDDHRGTREFRLHVTGVLVRRVLARSIERARESLQSQAE